MHWTTVPRVPLCPGLPYVTDSVLKENPFSLRQAQHMVSRWSFIEFIRYRLHTTNTFIMAKCQRPRPSNSHASCVWHTHLSVFSCSHAFDEPTHAFSQNKKIKKICIFSSLKPLSTWKCIRMHILTLKTLWLLGA